MTPERVAQDAAMLREHICVAAAQLVQQQRGALHVSEEKRDCATGKVGHGLRITR